MPPPLIVADGAVAGLVLARGVVPRGVPVHMVGVAEARWSGARTGVRYTTLPSLPGGADDWVAALSDAVADGPAPVLSCTDRAVELLATRRRELPEALRSFESSDGAHLDLMDKGRLYEIAAAAGVRVPWSQPAEAGLDVEYPCIVKPVLRHANQGKRLFTTLARTRADAERLMGIAEERNLELLLTEHVPGPETALEGAVTVRTADGDYPVEYGRRKIRQYPVGFGMASLMACADVPDCLALNRRLLDHAGYVGISSLEAKRHARTGELVLIEINVRVPQAFGLGDACGADASYRTYATLAGLPLGPQPRPRPGVRMVIPQLDARAVLEQVRDGRLGWRAVARSYRGVRDVGFLDPRDPRPGLAFAAHRVRGRLPGGRGAKSSML